MKNQVISVNPRYRATHKQYTYRAANTFGSWNYYEIEIARQDGRWEVAIDNRPVSHHLGGFATLKEAQDYAKGYCRHSASGGT